MSTLSDIAVLAGSFATYIGCLAGAIAFGKDNSSKDGLASRQGAAGEQRVDRTLTKAGYRVLTDLTVQNRTGTHQIDHIVAGRDRLFVLETKTWHGRLEGRAGGHTWTLLRPKNRAPLTIYSPLRQNQTHAEVIGAITRVPITPIIVSAGYLAASPELAGLVSSLAGLPAVIGPPGPLSARIERALNDLARTKAARSQAALSKRHINRMKDGERFHPARALWVASAVSLVCALVAAQRLFSA